jgi:hypothetical protein
MNAAARPHKRPGNRPDTLTTEVSLQGVRSGGLLAAAVALADAEVPAGALAFPNPKTQRLAAVCYHRQSLVGNRAFGLGCRAAAEVLGVGRSVVSDYFTMLRKAKFMERRVKGCYRGRAHRRTASTYRCWSAPTRRRGRPFRDRHFARAFDEECARGRTSDGDRAETVAG